jgi:acid phosphatase class B
MKGNTRIMALVLCVLFLIAPFIPNGGAEKTESRMPSGNTVSHIVIGELFTGTWCHWCPYAEQAYDKLSNDTNYFDKRFVMIEWHDGDAYVTADGSGSSREQEYVGANDCGGGVPCAVFDGQVVVPGVANNPADYTGATLAMYKQKIDARAATTTAFMSINTHLAGSQLTVWVNATLLQDTQKNNFKIWGVLIEDENIWVNNANGHYPIRMTARAKVFSTAVTISKKGDTARGTGSVTINGAWSVPKLRVVGFLQAGSDREIFQAGINYLTANGAPALKGAAPPPVTMNENTVDTSISLDNLFQDPESDPITYFGAVGSQHINVSVDGTTHVVSIQPWNNWSGTESIGLGVADAYNCPTNLQVQVTVTHINQAPVRIKTFPAQAMKEGTTKTNIFNLKDYFYDCDDTSLTYTATGATNITTKIVSGQVSITAPVLFSGTDKITFTAKDAGSLSASGDLSVTVSDVNFPPTITKKIADITMPGDTVDKSIKLSQYFSDIDTPVLQYEITGNTNINVVIGTDSTVTLTPKLYWHGQETLVVSATDTVNTAITQTFTVIVTAVNHAPTLTSAAFESPEFNENTDYTTTKTVNTLFTDVDGQTLQYSVEGGDSDLQITLNDDYTVSFHPTQYWSGQKNYVIKASDNQYTAQFNATVKVLFVNQPPHIDSFAPQNPTVTINENQSQEFNVVASDVDNQPLIYKWTSNAKDTGETTSTYKFTSDFSSEGSYTIKAEVSDGFLSVYHTWTLKVKDVPRAPVVQLTGPAATDNLRSDTPITFTATATSPDGSTVNYLWTVDGTTVGHDATYTGKIAGGTHTVKVTVTDSKGQVTTQQWPVTVKTISTGTGGGSSGLGAMLYVLLAVVIVVVVVAVVLMLMMRKKKAAQTMPPEAVAQVPPPPPPGYYDQNQNAGYNQYPPPPPAYDPNQTQHGGQQPPQY